MSFLRDDPTTIDHPDIVKYLGDCKKACDNKIVSFELLQDLPLIRYSNALIILKWEEDKQDFRYKYWGSHLSEVYGMELTGKYVADGGHQRMESAFVNAHLESMRDRKKVFLGGTIDWRDKHHQNWNQVIQPLLRKGQVNETLTYVSFN